MTRIAVIIGSTRPNRRSGIVAEWVADAAGRHAAVKDGAVSVEVVDLATVGLPLLDEGVPALMGEYGNDHTKRWAATVAAYDAFVFVSPEYNHSVPAVLKNAIDYLFAEWNHKAVGFVTYGVHGGVRAAEHLRLSMIEVQAAPVRSQVALSVFTDFVLNDPTEVGVVRPGEHQEPTLHEMIDELVAWSGALKPLRTAAGAQ
ncbi:NADPH-dependent FMN reductase [Streptomyces boncukensis]|uniref:NAD(P)H-dependent oxidoreductase n=1 Tax=Streptomyces boncukensis TaxID=2711219 RepID=A0A6G4WWV9_9ACTN|nr:NADPH-dependent FMN reductase [Streptomyces boncukensis]NGO68941.1 NAD(P)H-dependent oxidoreductase [Streptomyces boncukensis]